MARTTKPRPRPAMSLTQPGTHLLEPVEDHDNFIASRPRNSQHYSQHTGWRRKSAARKVIAALILRTVGAPGFEPGTFWSQTRRATGLRYAPSTTYATVYKNGV